VIDETRMNVLLIGSEKDVSLTLLLEQALEASGCAVATFHPDLASDFTLPAHAIRVMQRADTFLYLVTQHSEGVAYIRMLTPDRVAPLCAVGVKIILVIAGGGSLPPDLAYLPCLFFLEDEMLPALVNGLVDALCLVDSIQPSDLYDLRFGSRDLEVFLDTAQELSMAYTGLESAWDEMKEHNECSAKSLFDRYTSNVNFGVNFLSPTRLENRASHQAGYTGPITPILTGYRVMEHNWLEIKMGFHGGEEVREKILSARCQTAVFSHLIYLVMALKLQPYCDQYLHMHGLKQKQEMHFPAAQTADAAQERLAFLFSAAMKQKESRRD
jgi:hypothetical protein